jgi:hypothetical protein
MVDPQVWPPARVNPCITILLMNRLLHLRKRAVGPAGGRKSGPTFLVATILTGVFLIGKGIAQSTPSTTNLPGEAFPRINADHCVTVRLMAYAAIRVMLEGGDGLVAQPLEMIKNAEGVVEGTTQPAASGFHFHDSRWTGCASMIRERRWISAGAATPAEFRHQKSSRHGGRRWYGPASCKSTMNHAAH